MSILYSSFSKHLVNDCHIPIPYNSGIQPSEAALKKLRGVV